MEILVLGITYLFWRAAKNKERETEARCQANREKLEAYYRKFDEERAESVKRFNKMVYRSKSSLS